MLLAAVDTYLGGNHGPGEPSSVGQYPSKLKTRHLSSWLRSDLLKTASQHFGIQHSKLQYGGTWAPAPPSETGAVRRGPADGEGGRGVGRGVKPQQDKEWREKGQWGTLLELRAG